MLFGKYINVISLYYLSCAYPNFIVVEVEFNETIAPTQSAHVPAFSADAPTFDTQAPAEPRISSAQAPNTMSKRKVIKSKSGGN